MRHVYFFRPILSSATYLTGSIDSHLWLRRLPNRVKTRFEGALKKIKGGGK